MRVLQPSSRMKCNSKTGKFTNPSNFLNPQTAMPFFPPKLPPTISRQLSSQTFHNSFTSEIHSTLYTLLAQCSSLSHLKQLHAQLILRRLAAHTLTLSALISSLSLLPHLPYALLVFRHTPNPNTHIHNTLIRAHSSLHPSLALHIYHSLLSSGLKPNEFTFPFVLKACCASREFSSPRVGLGVHCRAVKLGYGRHECVANGLISFYGGFGFVGSARHVFDEMLGRSIVSWNAMIGGYSQSGCIDVAVGLFNEMRGCGVGVDVFTLTSLLSSCSRGYDLGVGRSLHCYVVVSGVVVDQILRNALLDMYGKCGCLRSAEMVFERMGSKNVVSWTSMVRAYAEHGCIEVARRFFDQMPLKNVVSWNSLISCYVREGQCREALNLYQKMLDSGFVPDEATLTFVLSRCSQLGDLVIGKQAHDYITKSNIKLDVALYNSLLDMYAKCGAIGTALDIFTQMPKKNVVSWNVIISALALHGYGSEAIETFERMQEGGYSPDGITFIGLLSACSHSGLLNMGRYFFERMKSVYGICPEIEHYACMVDLLGRRGCLEEAITLVRGMPMRPDIVVWGAILGACCIHRNVELAKLVMKHLLELEPHGSGPYVLLANIFGEAQKWEHVKNIRKLIKDGGVMKNRAVSSIEIDGHVNAFMVDDNRHSLSSSIYIMLDQLTDHLKSLGYKSYNPTALFGIEEF